MNFTLRDYQRQAAKDVLRNLNKGLSAYRNDKAEGSRRSRASFSLSALTGAGKTVIASAVIEAMLHGSADMDTDANPRATFLWVTDDPALNRQTRDRISQASDTIPSNQLIIIDDSFDQATFEPGRVYFLNTQKLRSDTSFVQSGVDGREHSLWDTVANTVRGNSVDLVLVLDEAHKGMKAQPNRKSLVRELIDGNKGNHDAAVPVVWGISATVERFNDAMKETSGRDHLQSVIVDNELIRSSGLVKDRVVLDNPNEKGSFSSTMLRAAIGDLKVLTSRWAKYTAKNDLPAVRPAMVIQVPDKASPAKFAEIIGIIASEWKDLRDEELVHVLGGDHQSFGASGRTVRYISPERIEDDPRARFILAKEAITTGWDCPRAEILYSERPGKDETHIAQLIGRIVRTPLAQTVLGDDRLNEVYCYLPYFDREAVDKVVGRLESGDDAVSIIAVRKTADFAKVPELEKAGAYELLSKTPCEPVPSADADPVRRAKQLAQRLSLDGLVLNATAQLTKLFNSKLDGLAAEHAETVTANVEDIENADLSRTVYSYAGGSTETLTRATRQAATDAANIEDAYKAMSRRIKEGIVDDYRIHLTYQTDDDDGARTPRFDADGEEVDPLTARSRVAALIMVEGVVEAISQAADTWTKSMLQKHEEEIRALGQEGRSSYMNIEAQASTPERTGVLIPDIVTATVEDASGEELSTWGNHVFRGADGKYPAKLNEWEQKVLKVESERKSFVAWYRNPSAASKVAIRIAYRDGDAWKSLQPDFVIISRMADGALVRSILDPHGSFLADALPKLQALADYAERYAGELHRVESLAKVGDDLMVLDLTKESVRQAILEFDEPGSVDTLYRGSAAKLYQ